MPSVHALPQPVCQKCQDSFHLCCISACSDSVCYVLFAHVLRIMLAEVCIESDGLAILTTGRLLALCRVFTSICKPYNGEDLVWHPVTASMSSMSYQSPDASQNMELKKGNIASFFKTGSSAKAGTFNAVAKTPITSSTQRKPLQQASSQQDGAAVTARTDPSQEQHTPLLVSGASAAAIPASDAHSSWQQTLPTQVNDTVEPAGAKVKPEVIDLAGSEPGKQKPREGDVLNTDDAGGIGELMSSTVGDILCLQMCTRRRHWSFNLC